MAKQKGGEIVVGLDIGTTKICAIVGELTENGIDIIGIGSHPSKGLRKGVVVNIEATVASIRRAVEEAELMAGCEITTVYTGIAGGHIKGFNSQGIVAVKDKEVREADITRVIDAAKAVAIPLDREVIHVLPQEFVVDDQDGIKEPRGMAGVRLEANFHIISGHVSAVKNILKCVGNAGLETQELILEPLASSESVLSDEEKEAGVVLVDIGGGTTDLAIFHEGIIRHTAVIPFGGNSVTEDIREGCSVMRNQAESLKTRFGSALADENKDNEIICVPGLRGRDPKEISVKNLAYVIQARMEEIIEHVYYEIKSSGYEKKLIGGIVITGGGAQLKHLPQLVEYVTGLDARIGYPNEHLAKNELLAKNVYEELKSPMFATGIGLLIKGIQRAEQQEEANKHSTAAIKIIPAEKAKKAFGLFDKLLQTGAKFIKDDIKDEDYIR